MTTLASTTPAVEDAPNAAVARELFPAALPVDATPDDLMRLVVRRRIGHLVAQIDVRCDALERAEDAATVARLTRELVEKLDYINAAAFFFPGTTASEPVTVLGLLTQDRTQLPPRTTPAPSAPALEA